MNINIIYCIFYALFLGAVACAVYKITQWEK